MKQMSLSTGVYIGENEHLLLGRKRSERFGNRGAINALTGPNLRKGKIRIIDRKMGDRHER